MHIMFNCQSTIGAGSQFYVKEQQLELSVASHQLSTLY